MSNWKNVSEMTFEELCAHFEKQGLDKTSAKAMAELLQRPPKLMPEIIDEGGG